MKVLCSVSDRTFILIGSFTLYTCEVRNEKIPENFELVFNSNHLKGKSNEDIKAVSFQNCQLEKIPQGLKNTFPCLEFLHLNNTSLSQISRKQLSEYKKLKIFICIGSQLEFLPGDLFEGFENLEFISFYGNKLKIIEPNILDGLNKLKYVNFRKNINYDEIYSLNAPDSIYLKTLKQSLANKFKKQQDQEDLEPKNQIVLKNHIPTLFDDFKNFLNDESTKDFKIIVDDREFHAHKLLLTIRSPVLAETLKTNLDAEYLRLTEISPELFEKILKFLYDDELPSEANFWHLFAAAGRLKIQGLKNYAAEKMLEKLNDKNAMEALILSNKYEHDGLKFAAFRKIKESHDKIEMEDSLMSEPEKIIKIIRQFESQK